MIQLIIVLCVLLSFGVAEAASQVTMSKADFVKIINKFVMLQSQLKDREHQSVLSAKATADRDAIITALKAELAKMEEIKKAYEELSKINEDYIAGLETQAEAYEKRIDKLTGWHPESVAFGVAMGAVMTYVVQSYVMRGR